MTGGKDWGFDALHHHELAHEWWGNLVTNPDWGDMWVHEGFGTYTQVHYIEKKQGRKRSQEYLDSFLPRIPRAAPVAKPAPTSSHGVHGGAIYFKGAWVLHTLRSLIGDEAFFKSLRRLTYPVEEAEKWTDGSQCRYATTEDYLRLVEELSGQELDWYFDVYVRAEKLPVLETKREGNRLSLKWISPVEGVGLPLPVEVQVGDELKRVEMPPEGATITVPAGAEVEIDPNRWLLREALLPEQKPRRKSD